MQKQGVQPLCPRAAKGKHCRDGTSKVQLGYCLERLLPRVQKGPMEEQQKAHMVLGAVRGAVLDALWHLLCLPHQPQSCACVG